MPDEIKQQIALMRGDAGTSGHIHFSAVAMLKNRRGIADLLERELYNADALVPATPWRRPFNAAMPAAPSATLSCVRAAICVVDSKASSATEDGSFTFAVWARYGDVWKFFTASAITVRVPEQWLSQPLSQVMVSRVDRYGAEGARTTVMRP
jgi:hypothetical protein